MVNNQLNNFIQVGKPIKTVTLPKYIRESKSIPITNIWCAQTKKPNKHIQNKLYNMAK